MKIRNVDDCEFSYKHGMYGGASGDKDGLIIDGENWLVKYPKNARSLSRHEEMLYTNDPVSEYIGSHIYSMLGYPTHDTMLVERRGKIAVACKDLEEGGKRLVEIRTIKNASNALLEEELDKTFSSTGDTHGVEFDKILLHLKYNDIMKNIDGLNDRFWDMLVIDCFINNNDRNNGNWGIIRQPGVKDELSPIFDNGGSLNGKTPDSRLAKMLDDNEVMKRSIINSVTSFIDENGKLISVNDMLNKDIPDLKDALRRNVPAIKRAQGKINELINEIPEKACSSIRKAFYKESLSIRLEKLLVPAYEKNLIKISDVNIPNSYTILSKDKSAIVFQPSKEIANVQIKMLLDEKTQTCDAFVNNKLVMTHPLTSKINMQLQNFESFIERNAKSIATMKPIGDATFSAYSSNDER